MKENDPVNPAHYRKGGIEAFKIFEAYLTPEELRGFCKATILQYILRANDKNGLEDYEKAEWYLKQLIDIESKEEEEEQEVPLRSFHPVIDQFLHKFFKEEEVFLDWRNNNIEIGDFYVDMKDVEDLLELEVDEFVEVRAKSRDNAGLNGKFRICKNIG